MGTYYNVTLGTLEKQATWFEEQMPGEAASIAWDVIIRRMHMYDSVVSWKAVLRRQYNIYDFNNDFIKELAKHGIDDFQPCLNAFWSPAPKSKQQHQSLGIGTVTISCENSSHNG